MKLKKKKFQKKSNEDLKKDQANGFIWNINLINNYY